jgi:hypothetical protein
VCNEQILIPISSRSSLNKKNSVTTAIEKLRQFCESLPSNKNGPWTGRTISFPLFFSKKFSNNNPMGLTIARDKDRHSSSSFF